jgi:HPt (histidine-containing phosphotransfer) domain-containing protein
MFRATCVEMPARLRAARAAGDHQAVRQLCHMLKGTAATVGAASLRLSAQALERACGEAADPVVIDRLHAALTAELQVVVDELDTLDAEAAPPG